MRKTIWEKRLGKSRESEILLGDNPFELDFCCGRIELDDMGFGHVDKVLGVILIPLLVHEECTILLEVIIGMIIILEIEHEIGGEIFALRSLELEVGVDIALIF